MPITYGTFTRQLKLLPITLHADGGATVSVRYGFVGADGVWKPSDETQFVLSAEQVVEILDAEPRAGMTRRNDLAAAVYGYLVSHGMVPAGDIT